MDEAPTRSRPEPTGPFDHPDVDPLVEQSIDAASGYEDQSEYATSAAATEPASPDAVLPPRAKDAVAREPLAARGRS